MPRDCPHTNCGSRCTAEMPQYLPRNIPISATENSLAASTLTKRPQIWKFSEIFAYLSNISFQWQLRCWPCKLTLGATITSQHGQNPCELRPETVSYLSVHVHGCSENSRWKIFIRDQNDWPPIIEPTNTCYGPKQEPTCQPFGTVCLATTQFCAAKPLHCGREQVIQIKILWVFASAAVCPMFNTSLLYEITPPKCFLHLEIPKKKHENITKKPTKVFQFHI